MKIAKIERSGAFAPAVIEGDEVLVIGPWATGEGRAVAFDAPARSPEELRALQDSAIERLPLAGVTLAVPASPLTKFICLGLNYRNHVEEVHREAPENPALFTRFADTLARHDDHIVRPHASTNFDFEGEIAVVIGKSGRNIPREQALSHVFGYTIMLDGSVRDFQKHSVTAGKNFWQSGSLGPWIVTADEIPDPTALSLETRLNGERVQHSSANLMLYDVPTAIAYISRWTPLAPGDVIATGTPAGVGASRTPPLWMKDGDIIEVEVPAIGMLRNRVEDER